MEVKQKVFIIASLALVLYTSCCLARNDKDKGDTGYVDVDNEKIEYAQGSVCKYCDYCQYCDLCDDSCPCQSSGSSPNCHMCKYCKYCYVCKLCDTVCNPGGIIDKVSAALVNALPGDDLKIDKEEVSRDIDSVKSWIDKKDEL